MKTCRGCIHEQIKGKPWWSTSPHPCTNCERITEAVDNYTKFADLWIEEEMNALNAKKEYEK